MPLPPPVKWVSAAAAPLGVASGARRLLSGGRASPHRGKDPPAQVKSIETRSDKLASTAPSAGLGRCLRMGGFWALPPPFPLCPVRGSGPVGLVPAGVWAAVPWHRIGGTVPGSVAPWFPLAGSSTGCCGAAGSPRVRNLAQPARSQRFASRLTYLAQVSDRWRAQVAKQAPGGALRPC